jgi:drug/metabolite transporter (DMT)-like permease
MKEQLKSFGLFFIPSIIWGSTWYAIKFQLTDVNPLLSVAYRFTMAGLILLVITLLKKKTLRFGWRVHLLFILQGLLLFGFDYWLVYEAEQYLTSGLIAVVFSIIVFSNAIFASLFLKSRITLPITIGGLLAIAGTMLIFKKEVTSLFVKDAVFGSLIMSFGALLLASLGNVLSAYNQQKKLPLLQVNAYSMLYGSVFLFTLGLFMGIPVRFDTTSSYLISLSYLAVFGSVVAFSTYLQLIGRVGPAKASYALVLVPVIAMIFSTFFESYEWQQSALAGMPILILGNLIAMEKINYKKLVSRWKL